MSTPRVVRATLEERFWSKVERAHVGCWEWTASLDAHGYGQFSVGPRSDHRVRKAHQVAYELLVGPIPEGMELDHLCRVSSCVAPHHLEPVTHTENVRRGLAQRRQR